MSVSKYAVKLVPVAAAAVAGALAVVVVVKRRRRRKRASFMPDTVRGAVEEILALHAPDYIPDGIGSSLYERKLEKLSDKQLLTLLALVEVGNIVRRRGINPKNPSAMEIDEAKRVFSSFQSVSPDRESLLKRLKPLGREILVDALRLGVEVLSR